MTPEQVVEQYLAALRSVRASEGASPERSYYPALKGLFDGLGAQLDPRMIAITDPAGREGSFPDVAIHDRDARVLALPVEVKPPTTTPDQLLRLEQGTRYARDFGGGWVLLTNLYDFVLARLANGNGLAEVSRVSLPRPDADRQQQPPPRDTASRLLAVLEFGTELRATLHRADQVAAHLAFHAREISAAIEEAAGGDATRLLEPVAEMFRSGLGAELDDEFFIPTTVQTLVYGLFAAWLRSGQSGADFDWQGAAYSLDVPLFAEVLHACLRPQLIRRCNLFPRLSAAAGVLRRVDRPSFEAQFAGGAIEYFYEPFLAEFDPDLRDQLGVWYTPREIAEYQVARANHHLVEDLGIEGGLADENVFVLDPASGTGTYLAAVYRHIFDHHVGRGEPASVAADRLRAAAKTRIVGFEILPAAFVISHLHLTRTLQELGATISEDDRVRVYLTNSLTGWDPAQDNPHMVLFPELEDELEAARSVKLTEPVLVVLGNPPYEGYSSAESDEERELVEPWIAPLWPQWGIRKHRLNDLYVRFWRIAIERIARLTGRGVVSYISNRQWLGGRSYPTMRETILKDFDHIVVDDLHGGVHDRSVPNDESIFTTRIATGIRVGTAIVTATRTDPHGAGVARVAARDHRGRAADKRQRLAELAAGDIDEGLQPRSTTEDRAWKLTDDPAGDYPALDEYFDFFLSGIQPVRDEAVLAYDRDELRDRMQDYWNPDLEWEEVVARHPGFGVERARYNGPRTRIRLLEDSLFRPERIVRYLHRPMDPRWLYWEPAHKLLNEARRELMPYWLGIDEQRALVAPQTRRRPGAARPLAASQVPSFESVDPNGRVFPMWAPPEAIGRTEGELGFPDDGGRSRERVPNVREAWVSGCREIGLEGDDHEIAEVLFYAIAGVCASSGWLADQPVADSDLPSVPVPGTADGLRTAASVGRRYADLVDPDIGVPGVTTGTIREELRDIGVPDSVGRDPVLTEGSLGRSGGLRRGTDLLWDGENGWRNIPEGTWDLYLGGFQPISKRLSYRVGSPLSAQDRSEIMHLARRLHALRLLEQEANEVYELALQSPLELGA